MVKNKVISLFLFLIFMFNNYNFISQAKYKLVIGLDPTFSPMGYVDENGNYAGVDIDLAKIYAERYNKNIEFKSINWETKEIELENGNIDLIWNGLTHTEERAKAMELSDKYLDDNLVLVSLKENRYEDFKSLKGKNIAVQANSSAEKLAIDNKEIFQEIKSYPDYNQAMLNLKNNSVDGVIIDEIVAKYISGKENINIYVSKNILEKADFSVAAKKGNTQLIEEINEFLKIAKEEGIIENLENKWFESNPNTDKGILGTFSDILKGINNTVLVYVLTVLFSFPLAIVLSVIYLRGNKVINAAISFYTWVFRGSPLMLQLFFFYYGLFPMLGVQISAIWCAVITFILNYLAYIFEILRGGIASVDSGQNEASYVLGYNYVQRFIYIILPQAIRVTLPSLSNEAIALVKDTSLINVLAITEILLITKQIANRTATIVPYIYAFIIYLALNAIIVFIFNKLEKKYSLN
ncbi:ABC transporter substrate-binding protein/permease [Gemelliphila palaticanis]|uniref:ABC transporter substrate-binding protein/permease n=1 Tax=Gemelliphila palaticanis TaxID=81950 RepID=A0ABX2T1K5_9BACL|nr:ABC transporter substrate-binding protein/permease [Gemella palaticanis]MBF0716131.1 ABC transporter substrate-binding protein/permease [Gemella palaticanis]NYS48061.1 ABC transporter substrate-binding protein/permease [Gemella palaticanis]